jgi:hypothetical protein
MKKIFGITRRSVVFLTLLQFSFFAFYLAGSRNRFLDSSLLVILNLTCAASILLAVCSGFCLILTAVELAVSRQISRLLNLCLPAPALASALILAFVTRALVRLSEG